MTYHQFNQALKLALDKACFEPKESIKILSIGTGGDARIEYDAIANYFLRHQISLYLAIDKNQESVTESAKKLKELENSKIICTDARKELDSIDDIFDIVITRHPNIEENEYTQMIWGDIYSKTITKMHKDSILITSHFYKKGFNAIWNELRIQNYQILFEQNQPANSTEPDFAPDGYFIIASK